LCLFIQIHAGFIGIYFMFSINRAANIVFLMKKKHAKT
jgi:hypothetical protein